MAIWGGLFLGLLWFSLGGLWVENLTSIIYCSDSKIFACVLWHFLDSLQQLSNCLGELLINHRHRLQKLRLGKWSESENIYQRSQAHNELPS